MKLENIVITAQSYKCGCGKGIFAIKEPKILEIVNSLIDWSSCIWPERIEREIIEVDGKEEVKENRIPLIDFLGNPPQLKPGNCIMWEKNVIAFDSEDDMVLILSETGPYSLKRFLVKVNIIKGFNELPELGKIEEVTLERPEKGLEKLHLSYDKWELVKSSFDVEKKFAIRIEDEEKLLFPITVWINKRDFWYNPIEVEKAALEEDIMDCVYLWLTKKEEEGN